MYYTDDDNILHGHMHAHNADAHHILHNASHTLRKDNAFTSHASH